VAGSHWNSALASGSILVRLSLSRATANAADDARVKASQKYLTKRYAPYAPTLPATDKARKYSPDLAPRLQSLPATLADINFAFESDVELVENSAMNDALKAQDYRAAPGAAPRATHPI
jgi:hypothetical protein